MTTTDQTNYITNAARFSDFIVGQISAARQLRDLLCDAWQDRTTVGESDNADEIVRLCAVIDLPVELDQECNELSENLDDLLVDWGFGHAKHTVVRVVLAGGGPEGWIDFTVDRDRTLVSAEVGYRDWWQKAITTPLSDELAAAAYDLYGVELLIEAA